MLCFAFYFFFFSFLCLVRARIVSFGEILAVPWKTNLVLDCLHVGEPRPSVLWQHRMRSVRDNSKHQIFPNGSLSIQTLSEPDQGDYTCSVQNLHGSDQILYQIIVQIPPLPQCDYLLINLASYEQCYTTKVKTRYSIIGTNLELKSIVTNMVYMCQEIIIKFLSFKFEHHVPCSIQ